MRAIAWTLAGIFSTLIGLIGLILPIIPGIVFLLLAAYCFDRASRRASASGRVSPLTTRLEHLAEAIQLRFWRLARRLLPGRARSGTRRARG